MIRQTIFYTGRVQGVGFRWTTANVAKRFAVAGTVQNLDDGRVKLIVEGEPSEVQAFTDAVAETMRGNIRGTDGTRPPATGEFGRPGDADAFRVVR